MNHHHHHEETSEGKGGLSEREKLEKLLEYWIKHNKEHADTYLEWSKKATTRELKDVAEILNQAANTTLSINARFKEALKKL
jgi:DNA invertase Pin-like site-specific DNA recombinase